MSLQAGIPSFQLLIALEPEAASLYCQHLKITKPTALKDGFQVTEIGTKYMVVDIGGRTEVKITITLFFLVFFRTNNGI